MKKGTTMFWKKDGTPAYEKQGDADFCLWTSCEPEELLKPVEKRYGWKWTDELVKNYYSSFMDFKTY
jgi:hypothetical protein